MIALSKIAIRGAFVRLSSVALCLLFLGCASAQTAQPTYDGMFFVSSDVDNVDYLIESATIAIPDADHRVATVYRVQDDGIGNIQNWEFRCKKLGIEMLADHDYEQFDDGTWGDADGPPKDTDFTAVSEKVSMGQVAQFACRWPKVSKGTSRLPPVPADPKARIQYLITVRKSGH